MKCPRTGTRLKPLKVGGTEVYVSEACGAVFFDNQTLSQFNAKESIRGSALVEHLKQFEDHSLPLDSRINCPRCPDTVMMRRYESPLKVAEIDECPACAGIWLDFGELKAIRESRPTVVQELKNRPSAPSYFHRGIYMHSELEDDAILERNKDSLDIALDLVGQYFDIF